MNRALSLPQRLFYLGVLGTLLVVIWFGVVIPTQSAFAGIESEILAADTTKARIERAIVRLEAGPETSTIPEGALWVGSSPNLIQADFQRRLGEFAAQYQVVFTSITPLSIGDVSGTATVALRAEGASDYASLLAFTDTVLSATPKIAMSAFSIRQRPSQPNTPEIPVSFQITFWGAMEVRAAE